VHLDVHGLVERAEAGEIEEQPAALDADPGLAVDAAAELGSLQASGAAGHSVSASFSARITTSATSSNVRRGDAGAGPVAPLEAPHGVQS